MGQKIRNLIESEGMTSFLAPTVHQPADLNTHVFSELQRCDGFVAVLQKRGQIQYESFPVKHRASVWIQQEIGILFYRSFLLGRAIPMRIYMEKEILHEGLTAYSIINPIPFASEQTILEDLSTWLKGPAFEIPPALAMRESLFQRRIESYDKMAAHSREPGDSCLEATVVGDFNAILHQEAGVEKPQETSLFSNAYKKLRRDGVLNKTDVQLGEYRYAAIRIEKQWWNLILDELRNRGRLK